jgi:3-oxoacyl-[acyl-carrier protein] reductase
MRPGGSPGATARDSSQSLCVVEHPDNTTRSDRVAIVTGGSCGIGREVTRKLASQGYAVVVNYARNQGAADAAVEEVLAANGTALVVRADVADELDVERLFTETTEAFGGVDIVVHAAAGPMILNPVADYDLDMFDALLRATVRGTFVVNQQASRQLRGGGAIVNVSSPVVGLAFPTDAAYAASEGAVEAITPVLARELRGRDITVNAVAPGLERPGTPADIANVVVFLVSEDGHWVNGQVIRANGGIV